MNPFELSEQDFEDFVSQHRTQQFLWACRLPGMWLNRALLHKRAADYLYERGYAAWEREMSRLTSEVHGPASFEEPSGPLTGDELEDMLDQQLIAEYLLLMGYAIECLLKGFLLSSKPELVIDEQRLGKSVAIHDLPQLCHDCSIDVDAEELRLLKLMTRYIVWGKYTAPLKVQDMPSWVPPNDQEEKSLAVGNAFVERRIQGLSNILYNRLYELLYIQRKAEMKEPEQ